MRFDPTLTDTFVHDKSFTVPMAPGGKCVQLSDGRHWIFERCIMDLSAYPPDDAHMDEAVGVSRGSSAWFKACLIRGAGKLFLCGSGDAADIPAERGKVVTLDHCILEFFGRRGPEVQDGMTLRMRNCLITGWGAPDRWNRRSFGAWAHHGGEIEATNCIFWQDALWPGLTLAARDLGHHLGQAWNYNPLGILHPKAWIPGTLRGLIATNGGKAHAEHCYKSHRLLFVEGWSRRNAMDAAEARDLLATLRQLRAWLMARRDLAG